MSSTAKINLFLLVTFLGRGMEDTLTLTQVQFCPTFMVHEETAFLRQLLTFTVNNPAKPRVSVTVAVHHVRRTQPQDSRRFCAYYDTQ